MSKIVKKKISDICDIANSDKTLTYMKVKKHEGVYPVYSATINKPFGCVNFYNNNKPCLIVVNDGAAGCTYIVKDEKYTIGKHITGLIPHANIYLEYLQFVSEPKFRSIAKGHGLGNLPKTDILKTDVEIPVKDDGTFDYEEQKRFAGIYSEIAIQREKLLRRIDEMKKLLIQIDKENDIIYREIPVVELFSPKGGSMKYSKKYCANNKGPYPVYSGSSNAQSYDSISTYDYDGEYLSWVIDGLAGYISRLEGKFSLTCHRGILLPTDKCKDIDLLYLKYVMEPIFRKRSRGRIGINRKNEYTALKPLHIKSFNDKIPIPVKADGTFDIEKQKEIADKYRQIDEIKWTVIDKINYLTSISVVPETV